MRSYRKRINILVSHTDEYAPSLLAEPGVKWNCRGKWWRWYCAVAIIIVLVLYVSPPSGSELLFSTSTSLVYFICGSHHFPKCEPSFVHFSSICNLILPLVHYEYAKMQSQNIVLFGGYNQSSFSKVDEPVMVWIIG